MQDHLQIHEYAIPAVLAEDIEPRRRAHLVDEIQSAAHRMAKDSLFFHLNYAEGARPDRSKPKSTTLTPEIFEQRAQNVLIKIANKMVGGRNETDQIEGVREFDEYVKGIEIGVDKSNMNWDHRQITAFLTEQHKGQDIDRGAFLLGMGVAKNMTEGNLSGSPFDMCDHFRVVAEQVADKNSVLVVGINALRDENSDMVRAGVLRPGNDVSRAIDRQLAERGVWLPGGRENMKAGLQTDMEGHVSRMLSKTLLPPEIQAQLQKAIVEIVAEANLTPLGGDEPQDVEGIKNEAVDMRAKSHWIFHGVAEDVRTDEIRDPTGAEITLKNLTRGVEGSAPEFRDLNDTDAGKKAFLVLASVRALLLSGVDHKVSARGYHEIMKVLLQRPDGQELRGLIENKIVNALSDAITESADANLVAGVVGIGESLVKAGSTIDMLAEIQRKIQQKMERLRAEGDAVAEAKSIIQEATKEPSDPAADRVTKIIEAIPEPPQPSSAVEKALELLAKLSPAEKERVLASL